MKAYKCWHEHREQAQIVHAESARAAALNYAYGHIRPPDMHAQTAFKAVEVRVQPEEGDTIMVYLEGGYMWRWGA